MFSEADAGLLEHLGWSFKPLTIVIKRSILYVAGVLDPSLFFVTSFEDLFVSWDTREKHTFVKFLLRVPENRCF